MAPNLNILLLLVLKLSFLSIFRCDVHKKYIMCFFNVLTLNVVKCSVRNILQNSTEHIYFVM